MTTDVRGRDRLHLLLLGAIVVAGALLRLRWLGEPMRYDEAATFQQYVIQSPGLITSTYDHPNNQILYSLLTHFSWSAFGASLWAVRLVALVSGILIVPVSYLVARRLYDPTAALWAAALTATSAPLIDYSVNGRGYTLAILLMLTALWLAARLLEQPRAWAWAALVACSTLAVYTVPTMAAGVFAVALWMAGSALIPRGERDVGMAIRIAAAVAVTAGLSVLLYSPVLGQGGWQAVTPLDRSWGPIRDLVSAVWGNWNRAAVHPLDWLIAAGFLASLALHRRIGRQPVPIAAAALATLAGVIAVGPLSPFVRSWLYLLPLYLIAAGAGLAWAARQIARSWEPVAALAAACAAVALGAATLHAGLRGADVPPISDNDIVGLLHRLVPAHQRAVLNRYVAAPVRYYYFYRFGGESLVTRRVGRTERDAGHVVVVVPHGEPPLVTFHMAHGAASGPPRHLLSREWIDFYDVPVANVRVP